jgi:hypothetical protein
MLFGKAVRAKVSALAAPYDGQALSLSTSHPTEPFQQMAKSQKASPSYDNTTHAQVFEDSAVVRHQCAAPASAPFETLAHINL